ncbi:MAG: RNA polymerase subunit sigma-24, partial [Planctomycetaceae bacterium]|nr:RNA polymerase subunit sigma-24 [Planctomycetaceae bacterium]
MEQGSDGSVPGVEALLAERRRVEALARRLAGNAADGDDVAQETWLR